jgi:O-methyltransferase involved in polyketide biosynthesis
LKDERAFFSWLGTVPYLSEAAVFNVLRDLASFAARGSEIVFDYSIPTYMWTQEERKALGRILRLIERSRFHGAIWQMRTIGIFGQ